MTKYAKMIVEKDNVVTAVANFKAGEEVTVKHLDSETYFRCNQDVPFGHKIALKDIKKGERITKYGQAIGCASRDILKGDWVHTHNVIDDYKCLDREGNPLPGQD